MKPMLAKGHQCAINRLSIFHQTCAKRRQITVEAKIAGHNSKKVVGDGNYPLGEGGGVPTYNLYLFDGFDLRDDQGTEITVRSKKGRCHLNPPLRRCHCPPSYNLEQSAA
jgi:hypothetical protein